MGWNGGGGLEVAAVISYDEPEAFITRTWCFRHWGHFERGSNDQNEIHALPILLQRTIEVVCKFLPEESYVGLCEPAGKVC